MIFALIVSYFISSFLISLVADFSFPQNCISYVYIRFIIYDNRVLAIIPYCINRKRNKYFILKRSS